MNHANTSHLLHSFFKKLTLMRKLYLCLLLLIPLATSLFAQVDYTAKDRVPTYEDVFRPGSNLGYFPPWKDENLANIAAGNPELGLEGVGIKAIRPGLFGSFVEQWGYELRVPTYEHFDRLGLKDNTLIVGFPSEDQRDTTFYCDEYQSEMFANLYEPIWDDGENGTPVNENNYYALYLYKLVTIYGDYVKFWEIWNEPGFDYTGAKGWLPPGHNENWWDNNPEPCDYKLRAPIYNYIRTLRISYEIIKTLSPEDYVCVSGTGYPSFLDAIMRNTDNPENGAPTADFPHGGGAYFDVMGFHSYPHFDGATRRWNNDIRAFEYSRHSDAAAAGIARTKGIYSDILEQYGYNGQQYPEKEWIITEFNIPRRTYSENLGGEEIQINTLMKSFVVTQRENILQMHIYSLAEQKTDREARTEFDLMGLYEKVLGLTPYKQTYTSAGIAYKGCSDQLFGKRYDAERTAALNLPSHIDGGAFRDEQGFYTYMLWAKTQTDQSEEAYAVYSFPESLDIFELAAHFWDYAVSKESYLIASSSVELTGRPIILQESIFTYKNPDCAPTSVGILGMNPPNAASWEWMVELSDSTTQELTGRSINPRFEEAGNYQIQLTIKDEAGEVIATQQEYVLIEGDPIIDFEVNVAGPIVSIVGAAFDNVDLFEWSFGDGTTAETDVPFHTYAQSGDYEVRLIATNECSSVEKTIPIEVRLPSPDRVGYNANDAIVPYDGFFRPGTNLGYFPPWSDVQLATIAAGDPSQEVDGTGVRALRPALYGSFLDEWGYDFRVETFDAYKNLGLEDNTLIVGFPSLKETDLNLYCPDTHSELFDQLYTDIWDDGENGTPINENNYYATYLYKLIQNYGDHVKFWEIWNEPGFDYTGGKGWLADDQPGNWWVDNPDPCDYKLRAPIQHYVRILRISYEVIKTLSPEDYVVLSGTGYLSFLDAVLRNTDNPIDGSKSEDYPFGGGAYFDVMGFHSYPHFDGSTKYWDSSINGFAYERHSDAAANGIMRVRNNMQGILGGYGYDGETHPEKLWTITEINIPRRNFNDFIGGDVAQRNFMMKAYISSSINDFLQMHVYSLGEQRFEENSSYEFHLMGLYNKLRGTEPMTQQQTQAGLGYETTSEMLYGTTFDAERTAALQAEEGVKIYAFRDVEGNYVYAIWAETKTDDTEEASATFAFPAAFWSDDFKVHAWDFADTGTKEELKDNELSLTASPIFVTAADNIINMPVAGFQTANNIICAPSEIQFEDVSEDAEQWEWTFEGGTPATSTEQNPTVQYESSGIFDVSLKVTNALGEHTYTSQQHITSISPPAASFTHEVEGTVASFHVADEQPAGKQYFWDFGDGRSYPSFNPVHTYNENGIYEVQMIPVTECEGDTVMQLVKIAAPPIAEAKIFLQPSCDRKVVNLTSLSSNTITDLQWILPGAEPSFSTEKNATVLYRESGEYEIMLIVGNEYGYDTTTQTILVEVSPRSFYEQSICSNDTLIINGNLYDQYNLYGVERFEREGQCDSLMVVNLQLNFEAKEHINERLCLGQSITVNGIVYDELNRSGTQRIERAGQCDSLVIVQLNFDSLFRENLSANLCAGETYKLNEQTYDASGFYQDTTLTESGCPLVTSLLLNINQPINATVAEVVADDGSRNGRIELEIVGGEAPYEVSWNNGETGMVIENLVGGIYEATIMDALDCSTIIEVKVGLGFNTPYRVYPNPVSVNQTIRLVLESPTAQYVTIQCRDVVGKVFSEMRMEVQAGQNDLQLNAPKVSGTYTIHAQLEKTQQSFQHIQMVVPQSSTVKE